MKATVMLALSVLSLLSTVDACNVITETGGVAEVVRGSAIGIIGMSGAPQNSVIEDSDCYKDMDRFAQKFGLIYGSISQFTLGNAVNPFKYVNQVFVDLSNLMESCSTVTLIS